MHSCDIGSSMDCGFDFMADCYCMAQTNQPVNLASSLLFSLSDLVPCQGYMNLLQFCATYGTLCKELGAKFRCASRHRASLEAQLP